MKLINQQIQYIEFACTDFDSIKDFYSKAFDWKFTDYFDGDKLSYIDFKGDHIDGGFYIGEVLKGSTTPILYADDLAESEASVRTAGGTIVNEIFSFPGGRRFHFTDPSGNELAVWSDK